MDFRDQVVRASPAGHPEVSLKPVADTIKDTRWDKKGEGNKTKQKVAEKCTMALSADSLHKYIYLHTHLYTHKCSFIQK